MGIKQAPENVPVWVDETRCKACDVCVSLCPSGVLGMKKDEHKILGKIISVAYPESCIGCRECELHLSLIHISEPTRQAFASRMPSSA